MPSEALWDQHLDGLSDQLVPRVIAGANQPSLCNLEEPSGVSWCFARLRPGQERIKSGT